MVISVVVSENFFQVSGKVGKFGVTILLEWEQGMVGAGVSQGYMCLKKKKTKNPKPKKLKLVSK